MNRRISIFFVVALLGSGAYVSRSLLPVFSRFGRDISADRIGDIVETPSGGYAFFFDAGDGDAGLWERRLPPTYGAAGTIWIDGIPTRREANTSPDSAFSIVPDALPLRVRLTAQVDGHPASSDLYVLLETSTPPDSIPSAPSPPVADSLSTYLVEIRSFYVGVDSLVRADLDFLPPGVSNQWALPPGKYAIYFARLDSLDFRSDFVGPVVVDSEAFR